MKFEIVEADPPPKEFRITLNQDEAEVLLRVIGKSATPLSTGNLQELYRVLDRYFGQPGKYEADGYVKVKEKK